MASVQTENNNNDFLQSLCSVSMCPPQVVTDIDIILNNATAFNDVGASKHFVIEFGVNHPTILVSPGQSIKIDDIIAYINEIPVYSKIAGTITEVNEKYIIGDYLEQNDLLSQYGLNESITEEDIKRILGI